MPALTCPVCRFQGALTREGRCARCRALVSRPPALVGDPDAPRVVRALRATLEEIGPARALAHVLPGKWLPLLASYAIATASLALVHRVLSTGLAALAKAMAGHANLPELAWALLGFPLFLPCTALLALLMLTNARELMLMALARTPRAQLGVRVPIEDARFYALRLRGRRAFAAHVTFGTEKLPPTARVGLEVTLQDERGKVLPARLPRYQAPDGQFRARELSAPLGTQDDYRFTLATIWPVTALGLPGNPGESVRVRAELTLTLDGTPQATQNLVTEFVAREEDFPAPPKPRDGEVPEAASPEEVDFVGELIAGEGACPVCGDALAEGALCCDDCGVPHHAECWAFAGRCSTYGCQGEPSVMYRPPTRAAGTG